MNKAREPTFKEMYGKDTEFDCKVIALSVPKTVGLTPTGEPKDANCWERRGAKKSCKGCCPTSSVKEARQQSVVLRGCCCIKSKVAYDHSYGF